MWDDTESLPSNTAGVTPPDGYSPLNAPPTGQPAITGRAHPGETLGVDVSGIDDQNGLTGVSYSYQWLADDTAIPGETASTYGVSDGDIGKAIKVRVSFTDDRESQETLTSEATAEVAVKPNSPATGAPTVVGTAQGGETLTVDASGIADEDGLTGVSYGYQWMRSDGNADTDLQGETFPTYALGLGDIGKTIKVRVSFADDRENQETLTSEATEAVAARPNTEPTGLPTISGRAQAGQTLAADTSAIADADGLINTTFRYQWIHRDGNADTDIDGATGLTYRVVGSDFSKTIKVRVSFTDDWRNEESLTSVATAPVAYVDGPPGAPQDVKAKAGDTEFIVSWQPPVEESKAPVEQYQFSYWAEGESIQEVYTTKLSQDIESLANGVTYKVQVTALNAAGYGTPSDELSVTPRTADSVRPETPQNLSGRSVYHRRVALDWDDVPGADSYQVQFYDWNARSLVILPHEDIAVALSGSSAVADRLTGTSFWWLRVRAVNAAGVSEWSKMAQILVTKESDWETEEANNPATGLPAISGTAQVGETLTAHTPGIADADGLDNAVFGYQWLADGTGIDGATSSTYTPADSDVGKTIKVRVSFTDDAGNEETLTSAATDTVAAAATAPGQPEHLNVSPRDAGALDLYWEAPGSDGGSPITGYKVQWKEAADSWDAPEDVSEETVTGTSHTLTGLTGGVEYAVRVIAVNDAGDGPASVAVAAKAAEQETGIWSADLTVGVNGEETGYSYLTGYGSLSKTGFSVDDANYTVMLIALSDGKLYFGLTRAMTAGFVLRVGAVEFSPGDASQLKGGIAYLLEWDQPGLSWSEGDKVRVGLTLSEDSRQTGPDENSPATGLPTISGTAQVGQSLVADTSGIDDADGLTNVSCSYQWIRSDGNNDTDIAGETASTYTLVSADENKTIKVRVSFTDAAGNEETLTSAAFGPVARHGGFIGVLIFTNFDIAVYRGGIGWITLAANYVSLDDDPNTLDYTMRGDVVQVVDDEKVDVDACEGTGLGTNQDLYVVDETVEQFDAIVAVSSGCVAGDYLVNFRLTDGEGTEVWHGGLDFTACADYGPGWVNQDGEKQWGLPTIDGTAQVGQVLTADPTCMDLSDGTFTYQWLADDATISGATESTYILADSDEDKTIKVRVTFTDEEGNEESRTSRATSVVAARPNTPSTGLPIISGTVQAGQTLTADTSGIDDADGLDNVDYSYQWIRNDGGTDTDIAGETASTYTLVSADEGKAIKVKVSFTDDAGNEETLTSAATAAVAATKPGVPGHLNVFPHDTGDLDVYWEAPASDGGSAITGYKVQWKESADSWHTPFDVSEETAPGTTHTITGLTDGVEYTVRVMAVNDVGEGPPSAEASGTPQEAAIWSATLTVGTATDFAGYTTFLLVDGKPNIVGALSSNTIRIDEAGYTVRTLGVLEGELLLTLEPNVTTGFVLKLGTKEYASKDATTQEGSGVFVYYWDSTGLDWSDGESIEVRLTAPKQNTPASGAPVITGTVQVGETLTADTSGIADSDGPDQRFVQLPVDSERRHD